MLSNISDNNADKNNIKLKTMRWQTILTAISILLQKDGIYYYLSSYSKSMSAMSVLVTTIS